MAAAEKKLPALIQALAAHGAKPAIMAMQAAGPRVWSFAELLAAIEALAAELRPGDEQPAAIIALCGDNGFAWVVTALAVIRAGCVLLPLDPQAEPATIAHILKDSEAGTVFISAALQPKFRPLAQAAGVKLRLLEPEAAQSGEVLAAAGREQVAPDPRQIAVLFYTSGTTGPPKGVPLSQANLLGQPAAVRAAGFMTARDRVLLPLPLHHVYPFVIGMLTPLTLGVPLIFPQALTGPEIIRALGEGGASILIGVPRLYRTLYEGISARVKSHGALAAGCFETVLAGSCWLRRRFGVSAGRYLFLPLHRRFGRVLRVLASGGSALDPELAACLEGLGWQLAIGYGLTETAPLLTLHPPGAGRLGSVGRAIDGVELKIEPPLAPEASGAKGIGEVLARGPNVFQGYYRRPAQTREAFTDGGWFRTGDLGRLDGQGFLYLYGRQQTLIVTESGKNIQPEEIEESYASHPAIEELGVFGNQGRLAAVIVPARTEDPGPLEELIRQAVAERSAALPAYRRLAEYAISHQALARTRLGKLRRHLLPARYFEARAEAAKAGGPPGVMAIAEMAEPDRLLLAEPRARRTWNYLAERYAGQRLAPGSSPRFDLGIDSLEWLDISLEIRQRTGVELSEEAIGRIATVRDLLTEVSAGGSLEKTVDPARLLGEPESVLTEAQKRWLAPKGAVLTALSRALYQFNRACIKGLFQLRVDGLANLPPGQYCLTPNHLSVLDPFIVAAALPYQAMRQSYFAGSAAIAFRNAFFRFMCRLGQAVPIDDRHALASSLAYGSAVLHRGHNLIWFPEGGRSADGSLQEFKAGIGMLLDYHQVPVVPVFIDGTFEALPRGRKIPRPGPVRLIIGRPLSRAELLAGEPGAQKNRDLIRGRLRQAVADLRPGRQGGHDRRPA